MKLFDDDDCIDGTLSTMETEEPIFKLISSTESLYSAHKKVSKTEAKSPLSSVSELAFFNNLKYQYNLIEEHGPSHNKRFVVNLTIGKEEYQAEGRSIKKAQQEAARLALNSTIYKHPPQKPVDDKPLLELKKTSVQKFSDWVSKYSDAKVAYYYSQHSKSVPSYHENIYHLEAENIHRVTLHINNEQFIGEGLSAGEAKEKAAKEALENLREIQGMCMFTDDERVFLAKVLRSNDNQSPISLVTEFASKTQTKMSFELVAEEGPAHLKNFIFKCSVGSLESYGEGSSKKSAKGEAAEMMVELLKVQASHNSGSCTIVNKKPKSRKPKNIVKSEVKTFSEEDDNYDFQVSEKLDPVSKLFQIQQKTRGMDPVFRSLSEKGQNNQFLVEVIVGELSFVGSGPNKKAAKKSAAEGMLTKMGYSTDSIKTHKPNRSKEKRTSFNKFKKVKSTPIGAGLHFNSKNLMKSLKDEVSEPSDLPKDQIKSEGPAGFENKETNRNRKTQSESKTDKKPSMKPKVELEKRSQQLGFRFQFSDFPKGNNTGFLSLLSLTTDPAKVCYGVGDTVESSQDRAALSALENIYKTELTSISEILRDHKGGRATEKEKIIRIMPLVEVETK